MLIGMMSQVMRLQSFLGITWILSYLYWKCWNAISVIFNQEPKIKSEEAKGKIGRYLTVEIYFDKDFLFISNVVTKFI